VKAKRKKSQLHQDLENPCCTATGSGHRQYAYANRAKRQKPLRRMDRGPAAWFGLMTLPQFINHIKPQCFPSVGRWLHKSVATMLGEETSRN